MTVRTEGSPMPGTVADAYELVTAGDLGDELVSFTRVEVLGTGWRAPVVGLARGAGRMSEAVDLAEYRSARDGVGGGGLWAAVTGLPERSGDEHMGPPAE